MKRFRTLSGLIALNEMKEYQSLMMEPERLREHLSELTRLQAELIGLMSPTANNATTVADLRTAPRNGNVMLGNSAWGFKKHGAGFTFESKEFGTVISMHTGIDQPQVFDGWRLYLYLLSLKVIPDDGGLEAVKELLEIALASGAVQGIAEPSGHFKLR